MSYLRSTITEHLWVGLLASFCLFSTGFGVELATINGSKAIAGQVIVRERQADGPGTLANTEALEGYSIKRQSSIVPGLMVLSIEDTVGAASDESPSDRLIKRIKQLRASGHFEYVEPDWIVSTMQTAPGPLPDDAAFTDGRLWGLRNTGQDGGVAGVDINVVPAWEIETGQSDVIVGVVDSGIRFTHNDIADNMWINEDEIPDNGIDDDGNGVVDDVYGVDAIARAGNPDDRNDHGTHVAGTISATAFNDEPHVGVSYGSRLMGLKFLNNLGFGSTSDAIFAIDYGVANGAQILNNSWGGGPRSEALFQTIEAANEAGVLFIAAAGNSALDNDIANTYPANYDVPNVISVAAVDRRGELASFSNFGAKSVDLGAPGVDIYSATAGSDSSYDSFSGTSMAAPHVAGVAALIKSRNPQASVLEMRARLLNSVRPLESLDGKTVTGGMVDAEAALNLTGDGILDLTATVPNFLVTEREGIFEILVLDLFAITGATVTGSLEGDSEATTFLDDGVAPDRVADDGVYTASLQMPAQAGIVTLSVDASASEKEDATEAFEFEVFGPPDNNDFANREVLQPGTQTVTGTNFLADSEDGENLPFDGRKTVWWQWNAPENGEVKISTEGSDFDTGLAIFVDDGEASFSRLNQLASNDDASGTFQSEIAFNAQAGRAYYIQVDGILGAEGDITLNYPSPGSSVPGGVFFSSMPEGLTVRHNRSFTLSADAGGESPLNYQWYFFNPDEESKEEATPLLGAKEPELSVDFADVSDTGSYFVRVSNAVNSVESEVAIVTVIPPDADLPENDDLGEATDLPIGFDDSSDLSLEGSVEGSNVDATRELLEPDHAGVSAPQSSVWYRWVALSDGLLRLNTLGSNFDTVLAVYTAAGANPSVGDLSELASNDDSNGSLLSELELAVVEGQSYFIAVDGMYAAEGAYELGFEFIPELDATENDAFADRILVDLQPGVAQTVFGSNVGATAESGEPNHASVAAPTGKSVWWEFVAPVDSYVEITTEGSSFDTVLAVYRGTSLANLNLVDANDDAQDVANDEPADDATGVSRHSRLRFEAEAGESFAVAVDGFGDAEGRIQLKFVIEPRADEVGEGKVLLIDAFSGFGATAQVLRGLGYNVTTLNNEAPDYPSLHGGAFLSDFRWVIFAPRDTRGVLDPDVVGTLSDYVDGGGHLLVTGFDSLAGPQDEALASLLGLGNPSDLPAAAGTNWAFANIDHPILDGPFSDLRGQQLPGVDYDFDQFEVDSGTLVLATLGNAAGTPRLTLREAVSGGSVGYWNGGLRASLGEAQPDFTSIGFTQELLANYGQFVMTAQSEGPAIIAQPQGLHLNEGDSGQLQVIANSPRELAYQWFQNDVEISGADASSYLLDTAAPTDAGDYFVRVSDDLGGAVLSQVVTVTVSGGGDTGGVDESLPGALQSASSLGEGWHYLPWFGSFAAPGGAGSAWIFRRDLGWLYVAPDGMTDGFWSWSGGFSAWLWTSQSAAEQGFYYHWNLADWLYIQAKPSGAGAWVKPSQSDDWIQIDP